MTLINHLQPASEFLSLIGWGSNYNKMTFFFLFVFCCILLHRLEPTVERALARPVKSHFANVRCSNT